MMTLPFKITKGNPQPYGVSFLDEGANFALASLHASSVTLCLFSKGDAKLLHEISLNPKTNKTGRIWHICLHPYPKDYFYLFRIDEKPNFLLDPYAKGVWTSNIWKTDKDPSPYFPLGVIPSQAQFNWDNDTPPLIPSHNLVIYEMHIRGFTRDKSSQVEHPGTFLGLIEKIPHLLELGVNAVEILPVHEFNEQECNRINPLTEGRIYNYWGYSTVNFFSPMQRYVSENSPESNIIEFKTMVRELHRHGIEVILDVVYNHTAEGNEEGPIFCFKGLDNQIYYMIDTEGEYLNYSGCGNTFNCNHPIVLELILTSLRYWVTEMHVDGFRFDLASILKRDTMGNPIAAPPLLQMISKDPLLANIKLIAEPWDAGGLYQVGSFFTQSSRWSEWNGRYRDVVRDFIKGTGNKGEFVTNVCGAQDLYFRHHPCRSVNFIIAHDGFTLRDLVSYNQKHNEANGEENRDGANANNSWNCGIEGPTSDPEILKLREQQMRNYHLALMVSRGIPMIHMGDEYGHTKQGNNNTWCQDNALSWFLWDELKENEGFYRFYRLLIHFRQKHLLLRHNQFYKTNDLEMHGAKLLNPNWDNEDQIIAFTLIDHLHGEDLYIAFNASQNAVEFELPPNTDSKKWHWVANTANASPEDFREDFPSETSIVPPIYQMSPYSAILLKASNTPLISGVGVVGDPF